MKKKYLLRVLVFLVTFSLNAQNPENENVLEQGGAFDVAIADNALDLPKPPSNQQPAQPLPSNQPGKPTDQTDEQSPFYKPALESPTAVSISSNPGAANAVIGTAALGRSLGLPKDNGFNLSGLYLADYDYILAGGADPHSSAGTSLLILGAYFDTEKFCWWNGGLFGFSFMRTDSGPYNAQAGSAQIYDNNSGIPPRHRNQLYEYWFSQKFLDGKVVFKVGKMITSADFNNILRERPIVDEKRSVPTTSSLLYLPIYVTPTLIGPCPGYYNSAFGVYLSYNPIDSVYISAASYDGNLARGINTGLRVWPTFNKYTFNIMEAGHGWFLGKDQMPGAFSVGGWWQTGEFTINNETQNGYGGVYCFGTQRVWYNHPGEDNSGILVFYQGGWDNAESTLIKYSAGGGFTWFAPISFRPHDSFGTGVSWSRLNQNIYPQPNEWMIQAYYQIHLFAEADWISDMMLYFTSIPRPGAGVDLPPTYIASAQLLVLF